MEENNLKEVNFTDPETRVMKMKKGNHYDQAYNCQLLIEDKGEIIVANYISNSLIDFHETIPTMEKYKEEQKVSLKDVEVFQDNGYSGSGLAEYYKKEEAIPYVPDRVSTMELHGKGDKISEFDNDKFELDFEKNQAICPEGHRLNFARRDITNKKTGSWVNVYRGDKCRTCKLQKQCTEKGTGSPFRSARINPLQRKIRLRFKTKEGIKKYQKRFHKGEVAQAHILYNLGYRDFRCRGINSCENEVNIFSSAYNLRKIYKKWKENGRRLQTNLLKILFLRNFMKLLIES